MSRVIWVTPNTYVGSGDFPHGPTPVDAGLFTGRDYLLLKIEYDERFDEAVMLIINDEGAVWSLSNRHLRVSSVYEDGELIYSLELRKNVLGFSEE
jgi:hypothetical protein